MVVEINKYFTDLVERFESEKSRIRNFLPGHVKIEHVGSSAVGLGGMPLSCRAVATNPPRALLPPAVSSPPLSSSRFL